MLPADAAWMCWSSVTTSSVVKLEHTPLDTSMTTASSRREFARGLAVVALAGSLRVAAAGRASRDGFIDVRDFGAKGDGKADDTTAIQAAIDEALKRRVQTVLLPAGRYVTSDTLQLGDDGFSTLELTGEGSYAYGGGHTAGAVILPLRADRPAINVQGARGTVIRRLSIAGLNRAHIEAKVADPPAAVIRAITGGTTRSCRRMGSAVSRRMPP